MKTRLASATNNNFALEFYKIITENIFDEIEKLGPGIDKLLYCFGMDSLKKIKRWVNKDFRFYVQVGNNLGEKMSSAFYQAFKNNYDKVLILGSDIPELTCEIIESAFDLLSESNVVIAPSEDGGYSLLGTDNFIRLYMKIFSGVQIWCLVKLNL